MGVPSSFERCEGISSYLVQKDSTARPADSTVLAHPYHLLRISGILFVYAFTV
ncbi:hypothetical protein COLSTE_01903 [Collinsella stercoris DSM 13279]|uniref:Uncharacterized protein n=1 Tax=Collinsella stercoris DSM 13279 TaxID=445975 RepID=B6GCT0_9ACTN|nr:hypothetical protein COLSTE_01903 [Collinsella stercoris DSM 13279]